MSSYCYYTLKLIDTVLFPRDIRELVAIAIICEFARTRIKAPHLALIQNILLRKLQRYRKVVNHLPAREMFSQRWLINIPAGGNETSGSHNLLMVADKTI